MTLDQKIEGYLFFKGEPVSLKELASVLGTDRASIRAAASVLGEKLSGRGLVLVENDDALMLGTRPELGPLFEEMRRKELSGELSKASIETLAIILYKAGVARSEIDYIRGVNSGFILRNLLVRGLIAKETDPNDSRRYVYKPSFDMLAQLGVQKVSDLPNYASIHEALVAGDVTEPEIPEADVDVVETEETVLAVEESNEMPS